MLVTPPYTHTHTHVHTCTHLLSSPPANLTLASEVSPKGTGSAIPKTAAFQTAQPVKCFPIIWPKPYRPGLGCLRDGSGLMPGGSSIADLVHPAL